MSDTPDARKVAEDMRQRTRMKIIGLCGGCAEDVLVLLDIAILTARLAQAEKMWPMLGYEQEHEIDRLTRELEALK